MSLKATLQKVIIEENNYLIIYVPNNLTDQFQPVDFKVDGQAKVLGYVGNSKVAQIFWKFQATFPESSEVQ